MSVNALRENDIYLYMLSDSFSASKAHREELEGILHIFEVNYFLTWVCGMYR